MIQLLLKEHIQSHPVQSLDLSSSQTLQELQCCHYIYQGCTNIDVKTIISILCVFARFSVADFHPLRSRKSPQIMYEHTHLPSG